MQREATTNDQLVRSEIQAVLDLLRDAAYYASIENRGMAKHCKVNARQRYGKIGERFTVSHENQSAYRSLGKNFK